MDEVTAEIVRQWFHKAEHDLQNIRNNLAAENIPTDTVCFHAQQAIEKLLKGVLVANARNISKTHDLVKLLTDVADILPELLTYEEQLEEISEYGVGVRYPDDFFEPTLEEAQYAFQVAVEIETIILNKITLEYNA
ncbi:nucleotide-binding HEPN domain protein [Geotalea daltonii FRC-32]|uniref:Nucleotide-binding HEPN domain protein n=1 Tax=Geotalea daltonii (strain DSM 22248 / JCM 15807 / FRC-32) TaxID=316067 RepID=B9M383_GEODF|nr:HEPN domain-containing protein [Geotalea daltonii]ACM19493.1 nucleotide-binding HEPN domain protein [Geotalea daltonii FRC-32]